MGVPASEVGYTSATAGGGETTKSERTCGGIGKKNCLKFVNSTFLSFYRQRISLGRHCSRITERYPNKPLQMIGGNGNITCRNRLELTSWETRRYLGWDRTERKENEKRIEGKGDGRADKLKNLWDTSHNGCRQQLGCIHQEDTEEYNGRHKQARGTSFNLNSMKSLSNLLSCCFCTAVLRVSRAVQRGVGIGWV